MNMTHAASAAIVLSSLLHPAQGELTSNFDALALPPGQDFYRGADNAGGFSDGAGFFHNVYTDFGAFDAWSGFAYSAVNNPSVPGFGNQYAVTTPGTGVMGSSQYAVAFDSGDDDRITFQQPVQPVGFYINNTAYAALSMRDGDAFAKQFGGPTGNDPDFFRLVIEGRDGAGTPTGSVEWFLADFRSPDNGNDYILNEWTWVDLQPLDSQTRSLHFALDSSDNGTFGMNTPAYFALDGLRVVPEPDSVGLLLLGAACIKGLQRARRKQKRGA